MRRSPPLWHTPGRDSFDHRRSLEPKPRGRQTPGQGSAGASGKAQSHLRVPVHSHSGIFLAQGIHHCQSRGSSRQDPQRLLSVPQALSLRRSSDDLGQGAHVCNFAAAQKLVEDTSMTSLRCSPEKIRLSLGFSFSAVAAGIKVSGRPDLALVAAAGGATAAALFTKNRVVAAPVEVGRAALVSKGGRVRALVVNSGNANCATGRAGIQACEGVCREAGKLFGVPAAEIFPSSTGIIGVRLPAEKIRARLPELIAARSPSQPGVLAFAQAIMTTDTRPKIASARFPTGSKDVTVLGIAKGAGMIHPQLATMLVYLFTDAGASSRQLQSLLREACDHSLSCISIDGDTSTNDTVLLLASGASGVRLNDAHAGARKKLSAALTAVCQSLAEQIVSDGEGVQHVIRLFVEQARTREEALVVARTIASR